MIQAGGLADTLLGVERAFWNVSEEDYEVARKKLREWEEAYDEFMWEARSKSHVERIKVLVPSHFRHSREATNIMESLRKPKDLSRLLWITGIRVFLEPNISFYAEAHFPLRVTDLLLERSDEYCSEGLCLPAHAIAAHLGKRWDIHLKALPSSSEDGHINLVDESSGLVFDVTTPSTFSTLREWKRNGAIGLHQKPSPLLAFVSGHLANCSSLFPAKRKSLLNAGRRLHPEDYYTKRDDALDSVMDDPEKALAMARELIQIHPKDFLLHVIAGRSQANLKNFQEAESSLREALRLFPESEKEHIKMLRWLSKKLFGEVLFELKQFDEAASLLELILPETPEEDSVILKNHIYWLLGSSYFFLQRDPEALEQWERAIALGPSAAKEIRKLLESLLGSLEKRESQEDLNRLRRIQERLASRYP